MKVRTDRQEEEEQIAKEGQIQDKKVRKKGLGLNKQVNRYTGGTDYRTDMIHRIDQTDMIHRTDYWTDMIHRTDQTDIHNKRIFYSSMLS